MRFYLQSIALLPFLFLPVHLSAQVRVETDTVDAANRNREGVLAREKREEKKIKVPLLHESELEDAGPQLLLLEAPPYDWFRVLCDAQLYFTSNAALTESNHTFSDVLALTAEGMVNVKPVSWLGGRLAPAAGFRYQNFLYGNLTGRHDLIKGTPLRVDSMDFETFTPYAQLEWRSGAWSVGAGGRFAAYLSQKTGKTTYQEWAPSVHAGRSFEAGKNGQVFVDADFTYRFSRSFLPPGVSLPPGWFYANQNDRYDIGLNIAYLLLLGESWLVQPAYRFQFSDYVHAGASRQDYTHVLSVTTGYYMNEYFSLRMFASAEFRNSTDASVPDYQNFNGGIGVMGVLNF